jgi:protein gp37
MQKTKIEWCDSTWNPISGCLHGCEYCYARRITTRFKWHKGCGFCTGSGAFSDVFYRRNYDSKTNLVDMAIPLFFTNDFGATTKVIAPYPYGFIPTFHRYRLDKPKKWKEPRTVFVCSMGDLFGDWVPDEWIKEVFEACEAAPQHTYLFLTKNPKRYLLLAQSRRLPQSKNMWYGTTAANGDADIFFSGSRNTFISAEPLLGGGIETGIDDGLFFRQDGIIIGAMTGPGARKHRPKKEWIDEIVRSADAAEVPVFMKDSLLPIVGEENIRRRLPWEVKK